MDCTRPPRHSCAASGGFSLVELLVAMAIGLIGTVVIFQVFAVFEGQKRTNTSAGDAQQNGLLAMVNIQRDARLAGYGVSYVPLLGCHVTSYDLTPPDVAGPRNAGSTPPFSIWLAPVVITSGGGSAPDSMTFMYSNTGQLIAPAKVITDAANGSALTIVDSYYGFTKGDLIIVGSAGANPVATACTLAQLTATPTSSPASAQPGELDFTAGARFNNPAGLAATYTAWNLSTQTGGRVFDLGPAPPSASAPVLGTYSVASGQLLYQNLFANGLASPIVDGIVQLQAQYGLDLNNNGSIESTEWLDGCPAPAGNATPQLPVGAGGACQNPLTTDWSHVLAVRFAVLARSAQPEIPSTGPGNPCDTTTVIPTWAGGTIDPSNVDPANWQCYRYRVFQTTVPVRNLLWFPL